MVGMGVAGLSVGGILGPTLIIGQSPSWERTYQHVDQSSGVLLSVHAGTAKDAEHAESILRGTEPINIEHHGHA